MASIDVENMPRSTANAIAAEINTKTSLVARVIPNVNREGCFYVACCCASKINQFVFSDWERVRSFRVSTTLTQKSLF